MAKNPKKRNMSKKTVASSATDSTHKKKTLRKSTKKKAKNKNGLILYNRVKSLLWRDIKHEYKKGDYNNKESSFSNITYGVYLDCKKAKRRCTDKVIRDNYKIIKAKSSKKLDKNRGLGLYIRIKSLLWKEYKSNYKGIEWRTKNSKFLKITHQVYAECKTSGADCPDKVIFAKYKEIKGHLKRPDPFIDPDLYADTDGHQYWSISTVEFELFAPYLWIVSPMMLSTPSEFQVSNYLSMKRDKFGAYKINKREGYDSEFKDWVDWCNVNFHNSASGDDIPHWMFTKPKWNNDNERWETTIYITDRDGVPNSFGYIPSGGEAVKDLPKELDVFKTPTEGIEKKEGKGERENPIETESDRLMNKKIGYIKEIEMWHKIGMTEKRDNTIKKLEITNKQIEKLK